MMLPRYPIYVISKGRAEQCLTARFLVRDGVPFRLVVEPPEAAVYANKFGADRLLQLPFHDLGQGSIPARNWVKAHALASGATRHWIVDDNIQRMYRLYKGRRIACDAGPAFAAVEDFVDRYENVAIAGMNYDMFGWGQQPPFRLNVHVYSCMLVLNSLPYQWRGRYNEDTDLCLQALTGGWCTVLVNAFLIKKVTTMRMGGGNTADLYQGDGRLRMARALERQWPGVVETKRRYKRPQHYVKDQWRKFDTPLRRRTDVAVASTPNEYGLQLEQVGDITSPVTAAWLTDELKGRDS